jgi:tetratricopeptide (TPR) repeat protein
MSTFITPYSLAVKLSPYSGKTKALYRDYLQQQSFVKDITDSNTSVQYAISNNVREIIATREQLQENDYELLDSIDSGITEVNQNLATVDETLKSGFSLLSYRLEDISEGIETLTAKCDWGFSRMISEIGRVNDTLNELLAVAKTPAQTWAYNQFEIGRDAMRQELFPEALEAIARAINGFGHQTGYKLEYRFHYNLGIIYLGDVKNTDPTILDLLKAEQSFLSAARYAKADFPFEASIALTAAGWAAYCQTKLPDAENYTLQAIQVDSSSKNPEAYFQIAKIQMRTDRPKDALPHLRQAIEMDRNYMLKAATDPDFLKYNRQVQFLFKKMRQENFIEAESAMKLVRQALQTMRLWHAEGVSLVNDTDNNFNTALDNYRTNTYFGYLNAIEFFVKVQEEANVLIENQKERLASRVGSLYANIKEKRSRISAKAAKFSVQKWHEAETAYKQIAYPLTVAAFSYSDYQNQIDHLTKVNKHYETTEKNTQNMISKSMSNAEVMGKIIGGVWGGIVGSVVGGLIGGVIALLFKAPIFAFIGIIVGFIIVAVNLGSTVGKEWRQNRAEKISKIDK